jgi:transposase
VNCQKAQAFYKRLNEVLERAQFYGLCEQQCGEFYHQKLERPSLPPGMYFRLLMIDFFEGLDSRARDCLARSGFLDPTPVFTDWPDERTPDHVAISRTRRLIDEAIHQRVFGWVLQQLAVGA